MLPALIRIAALALAVAFTTTFSPTVAVPNFPDLTIRTRRTIANSLTVRMSWYFKGPRQRLEQTMESSPNTGAVILTNCDQKSYFILDERTKTYLTRPVDEMVSKNPLKLPDKSGDTADVTVTIDSVDTGERRMFGSYEARRVKTTITTEGNEEARVHSSKMETDGWYIDLPGFNCRDDDGQGDGMIVASTGRRLPRYVFRQLGAARHGFPIEETTVTTQSGVTSVARTEFLEISDDPLDPSLFEVPADYQQSNHPPER